MRQLAQLAEEAEVAGPRPRAHKESMTGDEMRIEQAKQAPVAGLDDGRGYVVGADHAQPFDLALGDVAGRLRQRVAAHQRIAVECEHLRGLVNIGRIFPSIVEHWLGQPFVGVILEQRVEKCERGIGRDDRARRESLFEPPNLKGRVDHRVFRASILAGKHEHRDKRDRNGGDADVVTRSAHDPRERDSSIAQRRPHLARVRRSKSANEFQRCHRKSPNCMLYLFLFHNVVSK